MNAKRAAKLMQIAHYYGEEKQVCKLMEELGEATSAASEVLMLLSYHEQGGKKRDLEARLEHLAAELADVVNVTEQVIGLFGLETDFKVARHEASTRRCGASERSRTMRYELSLTGGTFAPAVEDFDRKLLLLLDMMRSRGLDEGDVTLKISVEMVQAHPMDEDGVVHDLLCPVFKYETAYRTAQKDKSTGRIGADLVLRVTDGGAMELRDREEDTIFDMVEGGEK